MTANPHSMDLPAFMAEHLERAEPDCCVCGTHAERPSAEAQP